MAYIVAEPCIKCKYTDCVVICPVMCFHEGANILVIDPEECVDCGACVDECPVHAIYAQEDLPGQFEAFIEINATYATQWPVISVKKEALATADEFKDVADKRGMLDSSPGSGD